MKAVVFASLLAVVGCNKDQCTPAKQAASDAILSAMTDVPRDTVRLGNDAHDAEAVPRAISAAQHDFEKRLDALEQSLGCGEQQDCCARVAKRKSEERTAVAQLAIGAKNVQAPWPKEVSPVLTDLFAVIDKAEHASLDATPPKERQAWCEDLRKQLARTRQEAPPAWKHAIDDANKRVADAKAGVAAHDRRVAALQEWSAALDKSQPIAIVHDLGEGAPSFQKAKEAVANSNKACHK
jgi:hypothetical protein